MPKNLDAITVYSEGGHLLNNRQVANTLVSWLTPSTNKFEDPKAYIDRFVSGRDVIDRINAIDITDEEEIRHRDFLVLLLESWDAFIALNDKVVGGPRFSARILELQPSYGMEFFRGNEKSLTIVREPGDETPTIVPNGETVESVFDY